MNGNCLNIKHKKCKFLYDEHIDLVTVEDVDDGRLARAPVEILYHTAADLDDQARAVERDVETLSYGMQVREELITLLDALGLYPERLAELKDVQRIDRHNRAFGCRMLKDYEAQQARVQWVIVQRDPRRYSVYEG